MPDPVRSRSQPKTAARVWGEAAKQAAQRRAERLSNTEPAKARPGRQPKAAALGQLTEERARQTVNHAKHSTQSRLGKTQSNCKPRPEHNRPKGRGSGKAFVPWCTRSRR